MITIPNSRIQLGFTYFGAESGAKCYFLGGKGRGRVCNLTTSSSTGPDIWLMKPRSGADLMSSGAGGGWVLKGLGGQMSPKHTDIYIYIYII